MEVGSLGLKSIDLIKILGNLLDNAFEEAQLLPPEERIVELD
jgi:sensor histidine kinase regulating citrate/malate metabolism